MSYDQREFRKLAQESLYEAELAANGRDREHWLKVAEMWTTLALSRSLFGVAKIEATQPAPSESHAA